MSTLYRDFATRAPLDVYEYINRAPLDVYEYINIL
jgi:hypothetical protein